MSVNDPLEDDRARVGVVPEVEELVGGVAVVRVDRHERSLEHSVHGLHVLGPVVHVVGHGLLPLEAGGHEMTGDAVGATIDLAPCAHLVGMDQAGRIGQLFGHELPDVGEVPVPHGASCNTCEVVAPTRRARLGHVRVVGAAVALAVGLTGIVVEAATPSAIVDEGAVRDVQVAAAPDERCDLVTVEALAARHPEVRQFVVMATDEFTDTRGSVELAVRASDGSWRCQVGPRSARFGRTGTRPLLERVSGDGTTPAGVFPLGEVTAWDGERFSMFGNRPDPGVLVPYRDVQPEDCWGATANTPRYQRLVDRPGCPGA